MSQRDLAASIQREDGGRGISPAYLNDIEHDRRNPSDEHLIRQFAFSLKMDPSYLLMLAANQVPGDIARKAQSVDSATYNRALVAFRKALEH